jgi:hypothetical protein
MILASSILLFSLNGRQVEILGAALVGRLEMGNLASLGSDLAPALNRVCVGGLDGKDLPGNVLRHARTKTMSLFPLSHCPADLPKWDYTIRLGKPRETRPDRAEVDWKGLGSVGILAVCRKNGVWKACGPVGPVVGALSIARQQDGTW